MNHSMRTRVDFFVPGLKTVMGRVVQIVTSAFKTLIKVEKGMGY